MKEASVIGRPSGARVRLAIASCAVSGLAFVAMPAALAGATGTAPAGNNGHIQIDEFTMDGGSGNDPQVGCGFSVSFFGYDAGSQTASITVTPSAPTDGGSAFTVQTSWTTATRTSGNQLDQNVPISATQIEAAFAGVSAASQGYHANVSVEVTGSQGSDDKSHMVWIGPCATAAAATSAATTSATSASAAAPTSPPASTSPPAAAPSTAATIIPVGAPQTGAGGASHSRNTLLIALGGLALAAAGISVSQGIRRRRSHGPAGNE